jgi:DUF971 family protein
METDDSQSKVVPDPVAVNISRADSVFEITWSDGQKTRIGLNDLRSMCDCALCRDEREKRENQAAAPRMLRVLGSAIRAEIASVSHVGRYALGVAWKDGHQSIYTYECLFKGLRSE